MELRIIADLIHNPSGSDLFIAVVGAFTLFKAFQ